MQIKLTSNKPYWQHNISIYILHAQGLADYSSTGNNQPLGQDSQQRKTVKARLNADCDAVENISYYGFLNADTSWTIRQDIYLVGGHGKNSYYLH